MIGRSMRRKASYVFEVGDCACLLTTNALQATKAEFKSLFTHDEDTNKIVMIVPVLYGPDYRIETQGLKTIAPDLKRFSDIVFLQYAVFALYL